jgi:hypothetical protein
VCRAYRSNGKPARGGGAGRHRKGARGRGAWVEGVDVDDLPKAQWRGTPNELDPVGTSRHQSPGTDTCVRRCFRKRMSSHRSPGPIANSSPGRAVVWPRPSATCRAWTRSSGADGDVPAGGPPRYGPAATAYAKTTGQPERLLRMRRRATGPIVPASDRPREQDHSDARSTEAYGE